MQPACQGLNPLNYGWQLIGGVHVTVWYNSLQLPTQEEIKIHHKGNCEIELVNGKSDNRVSDVEFNDDSDIE